MAAITLLFVLYFIIIAVPASPSALLVLPVLLGLAYWGLRQNRNFESESSLLETLNGHPPLRNYLGLFSLPVISTLIYALAMSIDLKVQTNWILYLITTPLGFILFAVALYKLHRQGRLSVAAAGEHP